MFFKKWLENTIRTIRIQPEINEIHREQLFHTNDIKKKMGFVLKKNHMKQQTQQFNI